MSHNNVPIGLRTALAALLLAGCTPPPPPVVAPVVDPDQLALSLERRTRLDEPVRILFDWDLNESGMRVSGRGVARLEGPYRARLDLFLGNGETVVRAALVDGELRLPPGASRNVLPPPDLMWGVLGVFRPQFGIAFLGGDRLEDGRYRLRYRYDDGSELHYHVDDGAVVQLELTEGSSVVQRVEIEGAAGDRWPAEARYRNLAAFRELRLTRTSVERVESYPPDIWDPAGTRGLR